MDKRYLVFNDAHRPYHNKRVYNLMLSVAKYVKPLTGIYIAGDHGDCRNLSRFRKHPEMRDMWYDEREDIKKSFAELRNLFPDATIDYIFGNHEERFENILIDNLPQFYRSINLAEELQLTKYDVKWHPCNVRTKIKIPNTNLFIKHEGKPSVKAELATAGTSLIYGHTHGTDRASKIYLDGRKIRVYNNGWLGDLDSGVFDFVKNTHQWEYSFIIITVLSSGLWFVDQVEIVLADNGKYTALFEGAYYEN